MTLQAPGTLARVLEWLLVFAAFAWQGAWPVPEVNEPYYVGKAVHYWNPDWCPRDDFFATKDAHQVFSFTFGWTSLFLPLPTVVWLGRVVTWALLAAGWCYLGRQLQLGGLPLVISGILFAGFQERLAMAGEWVIGGVEAKGFAYGFLLFALGTLAAGRWHRTLILLGLCTAFHVLVGGWALIIVFMIWLITGRQPHWKSLVLPSLTCVLLTLPGLIPSLALTLNTPGEILRQAHQIYTFERLAHHLVPGCFRPQDVARFLGLTAMFLVVSHLWREEENWNRIRLFVIGSVGIALCGWALGWFVVLWPELAAAVLRYYWFRLSDVAVPLGMALWTGLGLAGKIHLPVRIRASVTILGSLACLVHLNSFVPVRLQPTLPRTEWTETMWTTWQSGRTGIRWSMWQNDPLALKDSRDWEEVCRWIANNTPPDARFLAPINKSTFKWYAGRSEVVTWKEIPQDAVSIVLWWAKIKDIYLVEDPIRGKWWARQAADLGESRLLTLAEKYHFEYILTSRTPPLAFEPVFFREDNGYVVYRVPRRNDPLLRDQSAQRSSP